MTLDLASVIRSVTARYDAAVASGEWPDLPLWQTDAAAAPDDLPHSGDGSTSEPRQADDSPQGPTPPPDTV